MFIARLALALLLASTAALPTPVSAHGREGKDTAKMSALLQSLFEMREARNVQPLGTVTVTPGLERAGSSMQAAGDTGVDSSATLESWVPSGSPSSLERGGGGLGGLWQAPSLIPAQPMKIEDYQDPTSISLAHNNPTSISLAHNNPTSISLAHQDPPSQPYRLGLLRVTGATAGRAFAPSIRRSDRGGAGRLTTTETRQGGGESPLALHGGAAPPEEGEPRNHDFVRDLRRQFELRQRRAHADDYE
jgi:hypothetical protein